jgi:hypothetical protein
MCNRKRILSMLPDHMIARALGKLPKRFSFIRMLASGTFEIMPFSARFIMLNQTA